MSLDYWSMKLSGAFVKHKDEFKKIVNMSLIDKGKGKRVAFPEEILPYVRFELGDGSNVKFEEFEIVFPDDQAFIYRDKLVFVSRSMQRQYKIAPTSQIYRLDSNSMNSFLEASDKPKYSPPEEIMLFDTKPRVFSKNIGKTHRVGMSNRVDILYCKHRVLCLHRNDDHLILKPLVDIDKMPAEIVELFDDYIGWKCPYNSDNKEEGDLLFKQISEHNNINRYRSHVFQQITGDGTTSYLFNWSRENERNRKKISVSSLEDLSIVYFDGRINGEEYKAIAKAISKIKRREVW